MPKLAVIKDRPSRGESNEALCIRGLTVAYRSDPVLFSVDATFPLGQMSAIVGPNGAGKSTLLKAALEIVPRLSGEIRFLGGALKTCRAQIAYVPQRASVDWDFPTRVADVVAMGLYPRLGLLGRMRARHWEEVQSALAQTGMEGFSDRQIGQLSGGQQQRVFLARALVQNAEVVLLDEPFAGVDATTEQAIIKVLRKLRAKGRAVIAVHHDLTTLPDYFDRVLLVNRHVIAEGNVGDALTDANLAETYQGQTLPTPPSPAASEHEPALA